MLAMQFLLMVKGSGEIVRKVRMKTCNQNTWIFISAMTKVLPQSNLTM